MSKEGILIISPFYSPNIGGVETHLLDLTRKIASTRQSVYVLTYSPLTTQNQTYKSTEESKYIHIKRYKWVGKNIFHVVEKLPLFDFLYLTPYLFVRSLLWMISNSNKVKTIHSHGINAALIGVVLSKMFNKNHVNSTHAIYENISGFSKVISVTILNQIPTILCLSKKSLIQLKFWGVNPKILHQYKYWINLHQFRPSNETADIFTILYVGRMIDKKGIPQLLKAASKFSTINFLFAGTGPSSKLVNSYSKKHPNIQYLGPISYDQLPIIYQKASLVCIPSQYPEGYGRVVMEAVASGIPVIGSNYGSIGEAVDSSVSILFKPTVKNLSKTIQLISQDKILYKKLKDNCRKYALVNFGEENFRLISRYY